MSENGNGDGYRDSRTFQTATIIYDATYGFGDKHLDPNSRLGDQMLQLARSGRQNISGAGRASAVSVRTELRMANAARSSLEKLLLDYEDYLRQRRQSLWSKDDPRTLAIGRVADDHGPAWVNLTDAQRFALYVEWLENSDPFVRANALICLIRQENDLLDRQIKALEKKVADDADCAEPPAAELPKRGAQRPGTAGQSNLPACPECGRPMVLRTAKSGANAGKKFLGCSGYPDCKVTKRL